jgi:hypothetical protein
MGKLWSRCWGDFEISSRHWATISVLMAKGTQTVRRTTFVIDDELMNAVLEATGIRTKRKLSNWVYGPCCA